MARRLSASARVGPGGASRRAASRIPSAPTISDRSMNRHSAASLARSRRRSDNSIGVACAASRYSAAASTVAPRVLAASAASASARATASSGPSAACPRWRARASGDVATPARMPWTRRSSSGAAEPITAWASSGWLNRTIPRSTIATPARTAGRRASSASGIARSSVSSDGSAAAAASSRMRRVLAGNAETRVAIRADNESGIGSGACGSSGMPASRSARAISRA